MFIKILSQAKISFYEPPPSKSSRRAANEK